MNRNLKVLAKLAFIVLVLVWCRQVLAQSNPNQCNNQYGYNVCINGGPGSCYSGMTSCYMGCAPSDSDPQQQAACQAFCEAILNQCMSSCWNTYCGT